jgi:hypothetical protein
MPSIVFDYGQGFEIQTLDETFRKHTNPQEYLLGEEGISLNPLEIFSNDIHGPKSVATRVSDIFDAVYQLGAIQRKVRQYDIGAGNGCLREHLWLYFSICFRAFSIRAN